MGRPSICSHKSICGKASWKRLAAREMISASVVDLLVDVCLLHNHASGKKVFGPASARNPPEVDRTSELSPAKSASVKHLKN
eukprot:8202271-Karenia_brevis.AAC.1